jgi:hypothetical protein
MIRKRYKEFINEEVGFRNLRELAKKYRTAEIYFHQDLDGVCSALAMKHFIERYYGIKVVDTHIIQYGGLEYAVKHTRPDNLPIIVDYAHSKVGYILFDHHDKQAGADTAMGVYAKASRSNAEIISGEISYTDVFTATDIKLIQTVDSADFLRHDIQPEDIQRAIFGLDKDLSADRNRFLMGLVVNRLLLALKNKRLNVASMDGKRTHQNRNILECLVMDCSPSLYSMYLNLKHYITNARSLEWDRYTRSYHSPKRMPTPEDLTRNLANYVESRKRMVRGAIGQPALVKHPEIDYDDKYRIVKQVGIGKVFDPGSYDRYVVFKNFPDAEFVCTVFPMGLIQVSCNPFREKRLKSVNLGEITKEVLAKYQHQLSNINIGIWDLKRMNEEEIEKMKSKYGTGYEGMGFRMSDLESLYADCIVYLPARKTGDMKTRGKLNLKDDTTPEVGMLRQWMDKNAREWPQEVAQEINHLKIPVLEIIKQMSGGHPSITNIQGFNYMSTRPELLTRLFGTDKFTDVMDKMSEDFLGILREKIDLAAKGSTEDSPSAAGSGIELKGSINLD